MNLAVLGNGKIVKEALFALRYVKNINVSAIWTRPESKAKGQSLAAEYGIPETYTDYSQLLRQSDLDFVYIGLINSAHYSFALQALLAGKHVILEKPACIQSSQIEILAREARQRHLFLYEAVTFLHAPFFQQVRDFLPRIAPVKLVQCNYSKYSTRYDKYLQGIVEPVFDPTKSGGTLLDLNIYNLNFCINLFGEPSAVRYFANRGFNGVDTSGILLLKFANMLCECSAAKDSQSPSFMMVQGQKGWIRIEGSPDNLRQLVLCENGTESRQDITSPVHRMVDEFQDFEQTFSSGNYDRMNAFLDNSIAVARAAEKAYLQI